MSMLPPCQAVEESYAGSVALLVQRPPRTPIVPSEPG